MKLFEKMKGAWPWGKKGNTFNYGKVTKTEPISFYFTLDGKGDWPEKALHEITPYIYKSRDEDVSVKYNFTIEYLNNIDRRLYAILLLLKHGKNIRINRTAIKEGTCILEEVLKKFRQLEKSAK